MFERLHDQLAAATKKVCEQTHSPAEAVNKAIEALTEAFIIDEQAGHAIVACARVGAHLANAEVLMDAVEDGDGDASRTLGRLLDEIDDFFATVACCGGA